MISPKKTWKGFSISKNAKSALKKVLYAIIPVLLYEIQAGNIVIATTGSAAGIILAMALNAAEFYFKRVETE